jgi:hypothetical protein
VRQAYRTPSAMLPRIERGGAADGARAARRMAPSARITARNESALSQKHGPSPAHPSSTPPIAGPTMRAALNAAELSAMPLDRSSCPTSSITNAWRAGMSNVFTSP